MNKQLIELGIQAGLMTGEKEQLFFCRPITQFDEYSPEIEKFAQLIVRECVNCYSPDDSADDWADKMRRMIEP
jgi:hypothetical protein